MRKDVNEIINIIRVCPAIYLGEYSITLLHSLLVGYAWAVEDCTGMDDVSMPLEQFTCHLAHKYQILDSLNWSGLLLLIKGGNEEEALSLLWKEWDEFLSKPCSCPREHFNANCEIVWRYCGASEPIHEVSTPDSVANFGKKSNANEIDANDPFDKSDQED